MAKETSNFGFQKPESNDFYNIESQNNNWDKVDELLAVESEEYPGCYYRTVDGETEWINPPMVPGVEYRTSERYLGVPVYIKVLENVTSKVNTVKTGITEEVKIIDIYGSYCFYYSAHSTVAWGMINAYDCVVSAIVDYEGKTVIVNSRSDMVNQITITLKYVKE